MKRYYPIRCPGCGHDNPRATCWSWSSVAYPDLAVMAGSLVCAGCGQTISFKIHYVPADGDPEV